MKKIYLVVLLVTISISVSIFFIFAHNNKNNKEEQLTKVHYISADNALYGASMEELVGFADYVFIGRVDEVVGNYYDEETDLMPYTKYKVTVIENYKGNLVSEIIVDKNGGYDSKGILNLLKDGDKVEDLLEEGKIYLLMVCAQHDNGLLILSFDGAYLLSDNNDMEVVTINLNNGQQIDIQNIVENQVEYERKRYTSKFES